MYPGKVIIAGAGPGDPELITLKAVRYLQQADVVLTDRLVSKEILEEYVNPDAMIIPVGKEGGSCHSVAQQNINDLLVEYSFQGKIVVRLKGGDVSFFSNVLDELQTLQEHDIPYEIIPGITAASGAGAYCGIPLTARGFADSVRFLTYHKKDYKPDEYWRELAETDDTLVFYMSGANLDVLVGQLIKNNISGEKAVAVIEQATTPYQRAFIYQLNEFTSLKRSSFVSPTLVIIGRVVNLHESFAWKANSRVAGSYFKSAREFKEEIQLVTI